MSWDASLVTACCGVPVGPEFGYTYNTTAMVRAAAEAIGLKFDGFQSTLDGRNGHMGRALLRLIANELHDNPSIYDAMNPENGWGDREGIVAQMRAMADAVPETPETLWRVT